MADFRIFCIQPMLGYSGGLLVADNLRSLNENFLHQYTEILNLVKLKKIAGKALNASHLNITSIAQN
jgi:hypothetical protein